MARRYRITFENVLVSAAQDLIELKGPAATTKIARVIRAWVGATDSTLPTNQQIQIRCRRLPATVSDGSGGTTPTPIPTDGGDTAASCSALANNTAKATTNGTAAILDEQGVNLLAGYDNTFTDLPPIGSGQAFVFELLSTVVGTVHLSGGMLIEEIGG